MRTKSAARKGPDRTPSGLLRAPDMMTVHMIEITPIHEKDGDRFYREIFGPQFMSRRLGRAGQWQGEGASRFGLQNPVQLAAFEKLLHGRSPGGEEPLVSAPTEGVRELGWRITISDGGRFSVLGGSPPIPSERAWNWRMPMPHDLPCRLSNGDWWAWN